MIVTELELTFNMNSLIELERLVGGDLSRAIELIKARQQLPMMVAAFTRHMTPAPSDAQIRRALKDKRTNMLCRRHILEHFVLAYGEGSTLEPDDLPEPYCSLRMTTGAMERFTQKYPEGHPSHPTAALRFSVWACRVETTPGLTEEAVGREVHPIHIWPLLKAHTRAVRRWAQENNIQC